MDRKKELLQKRSALDNNYRRERREIDKEIEKINVRDYASGKKGLSAGDKITYMKNGTKKNGVISDLSKKTSYVSVKQNNSNFLTSDVEPTQIIEVKKSKQQHKI